MTATGSGVERLLTWQFGVLALSAALYNAGFGALNALLPRYVVDVLDGTETTAGIVMGTMAVTALLTRPWFGRLADRRGARRIIVQGSITSGVGVALLLLGDDLWLTILSRLVMGAGNAGVFTGSTLLAMSLAPDSRRAEAAAYVLVAIHLGFGLGPIAGEAIRDALSYTSAWTLVVALIGASAACAMALAHRPGDPTATPGPLINRHAVGPGLVTLFGVFTFNGLLTFAPLYAREIGVADAALVYTTASATIVVVRVLFGRLPDRIGPIRCGVGALIVTAIGAGVLAFWDEPAGLFVGASLTAAGLSLQSPSFMSIALGRVRESERGSAMATYTGFFDVANALVGPTIGLLVSGFGYQTAFAFAGAMSLLAMVVLIVNVAPRERGEVPVLRMPVIRFRPDT